MSERGNLYRGNFPAEFMETVWNGCAHLDCLTKCRTLDGHCERLKLTYEDWQRHVAAPTYAEVMAARCPQEIGEPSDG